MTDAARRQDSRADRLGVAAENHHSQHVGADNHGEAAPIARGGRVTLPAGLLDTAMARRGLTGRQLSELSGVSEVTLTKARSGEPIAVRTLVALDKALGLVPALNGPLTELFHS
jgi:hypothetical protein